MKLLINHVIISVLCQYKASYFYPMFLLDSVYMHLGWGGITGQQQAVKTMQSYVTITSKLSHFYASQYTMKKVLRGDANTARWL